MKIAFDISMTDYVYISSIFSPIPYLVQRPSEEYAPYIS